MKEGITKKLMGALGIRAAPLDGVDRVILSMKDGSWMEFDGAQIMKMTMRDKVLIQIKGDPRRVVDLASAFEQMFPERCKYL